MTFAKTVIFIIVGALLLSGALVFKYVLGEDDQPLSTINGWRPSGTTEEADYAVLLFGLINQARVASGLKVLLPQEQLGQLAKQRADEMAQMGPASLTRTDGSDWSILILSGGFGGRVAGENHSQGNASPQQLLQGFLNNPIDSADFFYDRYSHLGIGVKQEPNGQLFVACLFVTPVIDTSQYAQEVLEIVNSERQKAGVAFVNFDQEAARAAQLRATEVGRNPEHERPNGSVWNSVLDQTGLTVKSAGENIAFGQRDAREAMNDWMNSPGHRRNILRKEFDGLGVGVYLAPGGRLAWSQLFIDKS
jgi:uncharacterized protein YkwD